MQQVTNDTVEMLIGDVLEYVKNFVDASVPHETIEFARQKLDEMMCDELYDEDGNCEIDEGEEWMDALNEIESKVLYYIENEMFDHRDEEEDEEEQAA